MHFQPPQGEAQGRGADPMQMAPAGFRRVQPGKAQGRLPPHQDAGQAEQGQPGDAEHGHAPLEKPLPDEPPRAGRQFRAGQGMHANQGADAGQHRRPAGTAHGELHPAAAGSRLLHQAPASGGQGEGDAIGGDAEQGEHQVGQIGAAGARPVAHFARFAAEAEGRVLRRMGGDGQKQVQGGRAEGDQANFTNGDAIGGQLAIPFRAKQRQAL